MTLKKKNIKLVLIGTIFGCCISFLFGFLILTNLSTYGIQSVQTSQRDTERRAALSNLNLEIASYYGDYGTYPQVSFNTANSTAIIGTGVNAITINLVGVASIAPRNQQISTINNSVYCYKTDGKTFQLGVYLETSGWGQVGTAQQLGNSACNQRTY